MVKIPNYSAQGPGNTGVLKALTSVTPELVTLINSNINTFN